MQRQPYCQLITFTMKRGWLVADSKCFRKMCQRLSLGEIRPWNSPCWRQSAQVGSGCEFIWDFRLRLHWLFPLSVLMIAPHSWDLTPPGTVPEGAHLQTAGTIRILLISIYEPVTSDLLSTVELIPYMLFIPLHLWVVFFVFIFDHCNKPTTRSGPPCTLSSLPLLFFYLLKVYVTADCKWRCLPTPGSAQVLAQPLN